MPEDEPLRVEFYARSTLPEVATRRRDQVVGRLEWLADTGRVSSVEVQAWERKVPVDADSRERSLHERFSEWADRRGVDLEPFFDTRVCHSMATGERGRRLVLPALALAVYRGRRLLSVSPHSTGDDTHTVVDAIEAIEAGEFERTETPVLAD